MMASWPRGVTTGSSINHEVARLLVISIQSTNQEAWLQVVQRAIHFTGGVLAISDLHKQMDWREACILSDMLLKCYMAATQHPPLELHREVDLEKGEALSSSKLSFQKLKVFQRHVDSGLFNVVLGTRTAFRALFIPLASDSKAFGTTPCVYDRISGGEDSLVAVVIPGYSLNLLEPRVPAPTHWVVHVGESERETQVFRCKLRPEFKVASMSLSKGPLTRTWHSTWHQAGESRTIIIRDIHIRGNGDTICMICRSQPLTPELEKNLNTSIGQCKTGERRRL